jgi:uncharacterized protein
MQLLPFATHQFGNETFYLLPQKALFWKKYATLIIADLHFGKAAHFRKSGIPVPLNTGYLDLLQLLIEQWAVKRIIFLGDLLHSDYNTYYEVLKNWLLQNQHLQFDLVKGNHDIIDEKFWNNANITIHAEALQIDAFVFKHHPAEMIEHGAYYFCGHIHPAVLLKGKAKQSLKLPCYYFTAQQCVLPAFGSFTGNYIISPTENEKVFAITDDNVMGL